MLYIQIICISLEYMIYKTWYNRVRKTLKKMVQLVEAVKYTDCISTEGLDYPNERPGCHETIWW